MAARKPFIAGNWKMYKTCSEAAESASELKGLVNGVEDVDVMIAPSFASLYPVHEIIKDSNIMLGAQDIFRETEGAFTGEVSASMLASAGSSHVIIGHSERRQFFGETDESVNKKIKAAVDANLAPVFCIGESEAERDANKTFDVLDKQVQIGLKGFSSTVLKNLVVAYEPVWAIGTGKTASNEQAGEVHTFLRQRLGDSFDAEFAESTRIIYGGSVKPGNIAGLMATPDVDGALVGGASLNMKTFSEIVKF